MADFTPITTQEQFDSIIGERLKRDREAQDKKYADYADLKKNCADYEKQIADLGKQLKSTETDKQTIESLQKQVKGYETDSVKTRIAFEVGLPYKMASRLNGEDEKSIREDAQSMRDLMGTKTPPPPTKSTEPETVDSKRAAMASMLHNLKGE